MPDSTPEEWAVVTRYVRPDNLTVIRHVYVQPDGHGYSSRYKAVTEVKRIIKQDFDNTSGLIKAKRLEITPVRIIRSPEKLYD